MTVTTDLVPTNEDSFLAKVEEVKTILRETVDLTELREIRDTAEAFQVYARARASKEAHDAAGEVRLWAERRFGELRMQIPHVPGGSPHTGWDIQKAKELRASGMSHAIIGKELGVSEGTVRNAEGRGWVVKPESRLLREFDEKIQVPRHTADLWEKLARIPEETFAGYINRAKSLEDGNLTAASLVRRDGLADETRVERGIYTLADGRVVVRWEQNGVKRRKTLPNTTTIEQAREWMERARGRLPRGRTPSGKTIGDAWNLTKRTLEILDTLQEDRLWEAKVHIDEAISHLHKAEDALVLASRTNFRSHEIRRTRGQKSGAS